MTETGDRPAKARRGGGPERRRTSASGGAAPRRPPRRQPWRFRAHARRLGIPDTVSGHLLDAIGKGTDVPLHAATGGPYRRRRRPEPGRAWPHRCASCSHGTTRGTQATMRATPRTSPFPPARTTDAAATAQEPDVARARTGTGVPRRTRPGCTWTGLPSASGRPAATGTGTSCRDTARPMTAAANTSLMAAWTTPTAAGAAGTPGGGAAACPARCAASPRSGWAPRAGPVAWRPAPSTASRRCPQSAAISCTTTWSCR